MTKRIVFVLDFLSTSALTKCAKSILVLLLVTKVILFPALNSTAMSPFRRATSVPEYIERWRSACFAVGVQRGSAQIILAPFFFASITLLPMSGCCSRVLLPIMKMHLDSSMSRMEFVMLANETFIDNSTRKDFAENSLVLIVPANSDLNITGIKDLTASDVEKISIGNPETAPVGKYATQALTEAGIWDQLKDKTILAEDVKQVLTYVERGEVDAGFVYMVQLDVPMIPGILSVILAITTTSSLNMPGRQI